MECVSGCSVPIFDPLIIHSGDPNYILVIATVDCRFFRTVSFQRVCPFVPISNIYSDDMLWFLVWKMISIICNSREKIGRKLHFSLACIKCWIGYLYNWKIMVGLCLSHFDLGVERRNYLLLNAYYVYAWQCGRCFPYWQLLWLEFHPRSIHPLN